MDTKQVRILSSASLTILMLLFQNFQLMPEDLMGLKPVDNKQRSEHAKELLGKWYKKSPAAQTDQLLNLHFKLYQEVRKQLPAKHRPHAFRITRSILNESSKYNFDPIFVAAIIKTESSYNPSAIGGVGEIGLMQIRPETAKWIARKMKIPFSHQNDLKDPVKNIQIGVAYMDYLREKFPAKSYRYIAAYNMGPKNVRRLLAQDKKPKEYPDRIYNNYNDTYKRMVNQTLVKSNQVITGMPSPNLNVY
jgi:soluble lytic murein transglycosylase